jgi:hypothetical protein
VHFVNGVDPSEATLGEERWFDAARSPWRLDRAYR